MYSSKSINPSPFLSMSSIVSCRRKRSSQRSEKKVSGRGISSHCATHQHNNIFHVVIFLWVEKSCKLLLVCFHIAVKVCHFESPLITSHHLLVAVAIIRVRVICNEKLDYTDRIRTVCHPLHAQTGIPIMYPYVAFLYSSHDTTPSSSRS